MFRYLPLKYKDKLLLFLSAIRLPIKNVATDSLQFSHCCLRRKSFFIRRTECNVTGSTLAMKPSTLLYSTDPRPLIDGIHDAVSHGRYIGHTPVTGIDQPAELLF